MWMRKIFHALFILCLFASNEVLSQHRSLSSIDVPSPDPDRLRIVVQLKGVPEKYYKLPKLPNREAACLEEDTMEIRTSAIGQPNLKSSKQAVHRSVVSNGDVKWVMYSDSALTFFLNVFGTGLYVKPGDSIVVDFNGDEPVFSGRGARQFEVMYVMSRTLKENREILFPKRERQLPSYTTSLQEYQQWNRYADKKQQIMDSVIMQYRSELHPEVYDYLMEKAKESIEIERITAFSAFDSYSLKHPESGITRQDVIRIYDSTIASKSLKWVKSRQDRPVSQHLLYPLVVHEVLRSYNFKLPSIKRGAAFIELLYESAKSGYKGLARERLLAYIIAEDVIGLDYRDSLRAIMLSDYYSQPGFPEYKKWVASYERRRNGRGQMVIGRNAPDFLLRDEKGRVFTRNGFEGKVVLMNFWRSGDEGCKEMAALVRKVQHAFDNDSNVVLLNISADTSNVAWLSSIAGKSYVPDVGIQLRIGERMEDYPMLKAYNVTSFPRLHLLDVFGRNVEIGNNGTQPERLIEMVGTLRDQLFDGPYIFRKEDSIHVYNICGRLVSSTVMHANSNTSLGVLRNAGNAGFDVRLKPVLKNEPAVFPKPRKVFCLSDIEGNYPVLRSLLISNGIMNKDARWTFGEGHLVFNGDMFDRGNQVTECLWLIYSLEEEAKRAGGYVHFIIGNHEIMNLSNNLRYVREKYIQNARILGIEYKEMFSEHTELGNWLRTKNIMEKIGDVLYVHGGISPELARSSLSIQDINNLARKHYAGGLDSSNQSLMMLFGYNTSPFWFRDYYEDDTSRVRYIPDGKQIDTILNRFAATHIVTGHTIVGDTVSLWYQNRIINVDTKHSNGKSEALLIDQDKYYRASINGSRELLFDLNSQQGMKKN